MQILSPCLVYLEERDSIPVFCPCGLIYTLQEDKGPSSCPKCKRENPRPCVRLMRSRQATEESHVRSLST